MTPPVRRSPRWPAVLVALAVLPLVGAGPRNGDVVGYLWQAASGHPFDRAVHAGYVLGIAPWLRGFPWADATTLDLLSLAACTLLAGAIGGRAGVLVALVCWPIAPFGEVDPVWLAAVGLADLAGPWLAAVATAVAVAVSPAALVALPWLLVRGDRRRAAAVVLAAVLVVVALTVASDGGWWWGERGVLRTAWSPWPRVVDAWLRHAPWPTLVVAAWVSVRDRARWREGLALVGVAALPADVPGPVLVGLVAARIAASGVGGRVWAGCCVAQALWSSATVLGESRRVVAENREVAELARAMADEDGLVAPFSIGARVSFQRTGDPYGLRWHPPGAWLREQRAAWCGDPPERVWTRGPDGPAVVEDGAVCP